MVIGATPGMMPEDLLDQVHLGDCREGLGRLPAESVDCVVTSPPYYYKRDYGTEPVAWPDGSEAQLGFERDVDLFVGHLADIFDQVRRVLKSGGSAWVNLGDTYAGAAKGRADPDWPVSRRGLCGVPWRFALEMMRRGWLLRNDVVWHKPNGTPDGAKTRNTVDHEYFFFFTKGAEYYFEQQLEPVKRTLSGESIYGRNKRTVWSVHTRPSGVAHYATYPPELVAVPIKESCPRYICSACGRPRKRIWVRVKAARPSDGELGERTLSGMQSPAYRKRLGDALFLDGGYSDCGCGSPFRPGVVLDPFAGIGTTLLEARRLGRSFVGFEISEEYHAAAVSRLRGGRGGLNGFLSP
jgi:DNA modification methylase